MYLILGKWNEIIHIYSFSRNGFNNVLDEQNWKYYASNWKVISNKTTFLSLSVITYSNKLLVQSILR